VEGAGRAEGVEAGLGRLAGFREVLGPDGVLAPCPVQPCSHRRQTRVVANRSPALVKLYPQHSLQVRMKQSAIEDITGCLSGAFQVVHILSCSRWVRCKTSNEPPDRAPASLWPLVCLVPRHTRPCNHPPQESAVVTTPAVACRTPSPFGRRQTCHAEAASQTPQFPT